MARFTTGSKAGDTLPVSTWQLRVVQSDDLPQVLAIEQVTQLVPWSEGMFQDCLQADYHCWMAVQNEQVLGFIITRMRAGECYVLNISVHSAAQRQGIGRSLLQQTLQVACMKRMTAASLEVRVSNDAAIQLYSRLGFKVGGRRKHYYLTPNPPGEDALVLSLTLT